MGEKTLKDLILDYPVKLMLSDGREFVVKSAEHIIVAPTQVAVLPEGYDHIVNLAMRHITSVEILASH